jgi:hypothetical protein
MKAEMEIVTILCNYRGRPFMQSFSENRVLLLGVVVAILIVCALLADLHPAITRIFQLVPYPSRQFQGKLALYCALDAFLSIFAERASLAFFARSNQKKAEGLVDPLVVESLADYISNDDDILPESSHSFGLLEMLNQNVRMQKQIKDRQTETAKQVKQKEEAAKKAQEDAQQYLAKGRKT